VNRLTGRDTAASSRTRREAQRFVQELGDLKGSYVKIGQMIALLGEHFLPPVLVEALHALDASTRPLSWSAIEPVLAEYLGDQRAYLDIEPSALAAASLAQVHRARERPSRRECVLKIQYPGVREIIDEDFKSVVRLLRVARWLPAGRDVDHWLAHLQSQVRLETDYLREQRMAMHIREQLLRTEGRLSSAAAKISVPEYFPRYGTSDTLCMAYSRGLPVTASAVQQLSQASRNALGRAMLELFFTEVWEWGLLQADANFGNYLITTRPIELVLLDFGSVLELDRPFQRGLADTIRGGLTQDHDLMIRGLIQLGCLKETSPKEAIETFSAFVAHLLEPLLPSSELPPECLSRSGHYRWRDSALLTRAGRKASRSAASRYFVLPSPEFALITRKLTGVFTFIAALGAEFNGADIVERHLRQWYARDPA
jgi:predicted unusual protein kinase regulating ubiquinone biosynthesis (AarF/ABC1/UbiB family)